MDAYVKGKLVNWGNLWDKLLAWGKHRWINIDSEK